MRKSMIRIATIALAVVMLSTCAITSIIAGYQTQLATATVVAEVSGFGMDVRVKEADDANKVLIPGGSGNLLVVEAKGQPSVAAALDLDATVTFSTDMPVVISVNGTAVEKGEYDTYAAAVEAAIEAVADQYTTATNLADWTQELIVSWSWDAAAAGTNNVPDGATITIKVDAIIAQS